MTSFQRKGFLPSILPLTKNEPRKPVNPVEKRMNHIRIHLLPDVKARQTKIEEPTLVFEEPHIYIGGLHSIKDQVNFVCFSLSRDSSICLVLQEKLRQLNITHIISAVFLPLKSSLIPSDVKHLFLKCDDTIAFDISQHFSLVCQFIEEAREMNGRVLVHCACGVSRSATLVAAYLIKHQSMSVEEALVHLRTRRPIIQPNSGFLRQLIRFNEQIDREKSKK